MPFIDTADLPVHERRPGWRGRYFASPSMTFANWEFDAGSDIHEHSHPQEEVWQIIAGTLRITIGGVTREAGPGMVAVAPANTPHSVVALTDGVAHVVDWPLREGFGS